MCNQEFTVRGGSFPHTFLWNAFASRVLEAPLETHPVHTALGRVGCKVDALKEIYDLFL